MAKTSTSAPKKPIEENVVQPNSQISVTIPWKEVEPIYTKVLTKAAQNMKADGFRKGKVPPHIAEKLVNQDALREEVINQLLPAAYTKAIQDAKLVPISRPEVDPVSLEKNQDWKVEVYFAIRQPITLGKYQDVVKKAQKVADKEIADKNAELKKAEKPSELDEHKQEDVRLKHIFQALVESIKPKVQEILIRAEVNHELGHLLDQLKQLNLKIEDYLKSRQLTAEKLQEEYAAGALASLQIEFILGEIARDQKITMTDPEIDEYFEKSAPQISKEQRQNSDYRSYVFSTLLKQKVIKYLLSLR